MDSPAPRASLKKWLLRLFLGSFLLAVAAPVVVAVAVLHISRDTQTLRNAALEESGTYWDRKIEVRAGSAPFMLARMALPLMDVPWEAKQAVSALRSAEVSIHQLAGSQPDRARMVAEADKRMTKRGWDRLVGVLNEDAMVTVYVKPLSGTELRLSVLVLNEDQMIAVTGRADLEPVFDLAMRKAQENVPLLRREQTVAWKDR